MTTLLPKRLTADAFARYGTVARLPETAPLAATDQFRFWSDVAAFEHEGATEIGFCTVVRRSGEHAERVDWMERHARTPEVLVPIDGPFLLPVMAGEVVEVFRVEPGEAVVLAPDVWHSAGIPVGEAAVTYFVLFRRGTPQEDVVKTAIPPVAIKPEPNAGRSS